MPHDTPLITTIVIGLCLAFVFGAIANRLRISPLVGYLLAGVICGPYTPGFVADQELTLQLAEIGVILLMFGVGLHFSVKELLSVKAIAVPGALTQILAATALGTGLGLIIGWDFSASLVFGLALSTASTVVLLRAMQERRLLETDRGRIAVGWLIVEDLVMVLVLVLMPAFAGMMHDGGTTAGSAISTPLISDPVARYLNLGITGIIVLTLAKIAIFIALMLVVGKRLVPWILQVISASGSRELFRLGVLAIALGVAFGAAQLFGVSLALGAFFAGMVMSESELSHQAAEESLPLRDAFAVLFFVSVGMLFDPMVLIHDPLPLLATLLIIMIGKSIAAFLIVRAFRYPEGTALTISASLAQIGEFSFILAGLGVSLKILPTEARDLILAGAILSILFNPLVFIGFERIRPWLERKFAKPVSSEVNDIGVGVADDLPEPPLPTGLTGHTVLVGYGQVGKYILQNLHQSRATNLTPTHRTPNSDSTADQKSALQVPAVLVIEDNEKTAAELRDAILTSNEQQLEVINGNASDSAILSLANLKQAGQLILAIPYAFESGRIITLAKQENPQLAIIARAQSQAEVQYLSELGAQSVILSEEETARGILNVLQREQAVKSQTTVLADEN